MNSGVIEERSSFKRKWLRFSYLIKRIQITFKKCNEFTRTESNEDDIQSTVKLRNIEGTEIFKANK
jgi:hypothetical protein